MTKRCHPVQEPQSLAAVPVVRRQADGRILHIALLGLDAEPTPGGVKHRAPRFVADDELAVGNSWQQQRVQGVQRHIAMARRVHPQPYGGTQRLGLVPWLFAERRRDQLKVIELHGKPSHRPRQAETSRGSGSLEALGFADRLTDKHVVRHLPVATAQPHHVPGQMITNEVLA